MKQANYAVADAVRKAHAKVEDKQKGDTLSLPHNKRASDADVAQKPANDAMPQVAEKALQVAVQALHDGANNVTHIDPETPRVVIRSDARSKLYAFFVDSENRTAGTLDMIDLSSGNAEKEVVNVSFYKQATMPVADDARDKAVAKLTKLLNVPRLIVRSRLVKEGSLNRDDEGKSNTVDIEAFKKRLIASITKAILEA